MNLLDRTIAAFSPRRALARAQARIALDAVRARYDGGRPTKTYRVSRDNSTGEVQVARDAATCRAQARDFERNNDIFRGALLTLSRNIVGANGISIEPQPRLANDDISDDFARDLLNLWREFTSAPDVTRTLDWAQLQDLACRSWLRDGEVFAQIVAGAGAPYAFAGRVKLALEMLEADYVPLDYAPDDTTEAGIKRDAWGRPLGYYVYKQHPGSARNISTSAAIKYVSSDVMLHLANRDRLSGLRGVSHFASILTRLHDLKDYEDSERLAARIAAAITAYVKRDVNMEFQPPQQDPSIQRDFNLRAGAVFDQTLPGEEIALVNPNRPNTALNDFARGQMQRASRGAMLSHSALSGDYNGTYSAQRQELVEAYDGYRQLTATFVARFVRPVWEQFVSIAVASGLVRVPSGLRRETLALAEYRGPKMPWIDPNREANALSTMVRNGFVSAQQVIAERGGRLQDVYEQLSRERRLAAEIGLVLECNASQVTMNGQHATQPSPAPTEPDPSNKVVQMKAKLLAASIQAGIRDAVARPRIAPRMEVRAAADEAELLIYGDIGDSWMGESVTARDVVEQLLELDRNIALINVRINSYGGSVSDGLAIYNALKRHPAAKAVTIDGVAMSIASLIAMAGDTVSMPSTSLMMIHAPWGALAGNAQELRDYAQVLDTYADAMADAYVGRSGKAREDILALLRDGRDHYYTGTEAVDEGFATDLVEADTSGEAADDNARAFASGLLQRYAGSLAGNAQLAIAAALRMPRHAQPDQPAVAGKQPPTNGSNGDMKMTEASNSAAPTSAPSVPTATPTAAIADRAQILAADQARRSGIAAHFAAYASRQNPEFAQLQAQCESDIDCTPEAAGLRLLALLGRDTQPLAGATPRIEAGALHEAETYRGGAVVALMNRANPSANPLTEPARQFRGFSLNDLARDCAERAGVRTRGLSKSEIAVRAMQTTSDFPHILENVISKTLRAGYEGSSRTFTAWARQGESLPDFKTVSRTQLSGAPTLNRVVEGAEYETGSLLDGAEKYSVQKYGRIVNVSWETIVNDDLGALTRIPFAFGASAADMESDIVYGILTANAAMSDTVALFHANHNNLGTATALKATLDDTAALDPIAQARELMMLQKGLEGRYITIRPKYLIVPPKLEQVALRATSSAFAAGKSIDINVLGALLTPVVEPRLHDASDTAYYLAADTATVDTIEYAYLQGNEGVFTETRNGFEVDGVQVKCRHVFGAAAIDYRGLVKNAGA